MLTLAMNLVSDLSRQSGVPVAPERRYEWRSSEDREFAGAAVRVGMTERDEAVRGNLRRRELMGAWLIKNGLT